MEQIALKQIYHGGVTMLVPEVWNVETEEYDEADGCTSYGISINAAGNDIRSIDISFGPMPEGSDAYAEACGTYEDAINEEDMDASDEPIICFGFKDGKAYGFSLVTDDGLPCFFFCIDAEGAGRKNLLTVLICAPDNEEIQNLTDFVEEYIKY